MIARYVIAILLLCFYSQSIDIMEEIREELQELTWTIKKGGKYEY
jgi:hypothetical protein